MDDLTRDAILGADDLPIERVEVPDWGGCIYVKTLTGTERDQFEQMATDRRAKKRFDVRGLKVRLIGMALCDKTGKLLFGGDSDVEQLNKKSGAALERVYKTVSKLSGLTQEDLEELAADFDEGPNANSGSD